jgi:hypothetical protein
MLKSMLCSLQDSSDSDLMGLGECPFDQVRHILSVGSLDCLCRD